RPPSWPTRLARPGSRNHPPSDPHAAIAARPKSIKVTGIWSVVGQPLPPGSGGSEAKSEPLGTSGPFELLAAALPPAGLKKACAGRRGARALRRASAEHTQTA